MPKAMAAEPYVPEVWRVADRFEETADTVTLTLAPPDGVDPGAFLPGQFNMLYAFGFGEVPISISGSAAADGKVLHTVRGVGRATRAVAATEPGGTIGVRGPFGSAWPVGEGRGKDLLFLAGGVGLAPLRAAIHEAADNRTAFQNIGVLYGARNPQSLLFRQDLSRWRDRADVECEVTVDHAGPEWRGHVGVILKLIENFSFDPAKAMAFICGPEIMIRGSVDALIKRGLPQQAIHVSMERNMKCAIARCGHCQFGPHFVCKDGPVFRYDRIAPLLAVPEM